MNVIHDNGNDQQTTLAHMCYFTTSFIGKIHAQIFIAIFLHIILCRLSFESDWNKTLKTKAIKILILYSDFWSYQVLCDGEHSLERCQKVTNPSQNSNKMTIVVCASKTKRNIYVSDILTLANVDKWQRFRPFSGDRKSAGGRVQGSLWPPCLPWGETWFDLVMMMMMMTMTTMMMTMTMMTTMTTTSTLRWDLMMWFDNPGGFVQNCDVIDTYQEIPEITSKDALLIQTMKV